MSVMETSSNFAVPMLLVFLLLVFTFSSAYLEKWGIKFIHQTGVIILLGFAFGAIIYFGAGETIIFEDYIFFDELLPIIIFAAGFNLKRRRFIRNVGYIMTYGVIGTIFTFILITVGIWL